MGVQRTLSQNLLSLVSSTIVIRVLSLFVTMVNRRLLGPELTGVWNLVDVLRQQCSSITIGMHYSADREMPMLRARGEQDNEQHLRSLTFSYLLVEVLVVGFAFWVYWLVQNASFAPDARFGLLLLPLLLVSTRLTMFYQLAIKNVKAFHFYSWSNVLLFLLDASTTLYILGAGLPGLFAGLVANGALRCAFYSYAATRLRTFSVTWRWSWAELKALLPFGIPIGVWNLVYTLMFRLDSLAISSTLGTTALGYYYLGPQLALSLSEIPNALSVISYPNLMEEFARNGMAAALTHTRRYTSLLLYGIAPLVMSAGYFGSELLVRHFLPGFEPGLEAVKISLLIVGLMVAGNIYTQVLLAAKQVYQLIGISLAVLVIMLILIVTWCAWAGDLQNFAWVAVAGQFLYFVLVILAAYRAMTGSPGRYLGDWGRSVLVAGLWIGLIRGVDAALMPLTGESLGHDLLALTLREATFLGAAVLVTLAVQHTYALQFLRGIGSTSLRTGLDRLLGRPNRGEPDEKRLT